jgi:hypothetical protein
MSLEEFLQHIKPDLTLFGVLIALTVSAFWFWRFFWDYEQKLRSDQIDKLRDLIQNIRDRLIDPIIRKQFEIFANDICNQVVDNLANDIFEETLPAEGTRIKSLKKYETLTFLLGEQALGDRLEKESEYALAKVRDLLVSDLGNQFYNELDSANNHVWNMRRHYRWAYFWCSVTASSCLILGVILLIGLLQALGKWIDIFWYFWLFACIESFGLTVISFVVMEFHRRRLYRMWEDVQLYGAR